MTRLYTGKLRRPCQSLVLKIKNDAYGDSNSKHIRQLTYQEKQEHWMMIHAKFNAIHWSVWKETRIEYFFRNGDSYLEKFRS